MLSKLPSCVCALPRALSHALASTSAAHSPTSSGLGGGVAQHTSPAWRGWVQARGLSAAQAINYANDSNQKLVDSLKTQGLLKSERCEAVMRQIDRRDFTTTHLGIPAHVSYSDSQLPIGQGQSISAPSLHATCLELLESHARPGALALDVGSGSGYFTACLSLMVGAEGRVVAVERYQRLLEQSGFALARSVATRVGTAEPSLTGGHAPLRPELQAGRPLVRIHNIELLLGNALEEPVLAAAAAGRQFDLVHLGAAVRQPPPELLALLRPGGRMVVAVGPPAAMQSLTVVDKGPDGAITRTAVCDVRLPPLAPPFADRPL